MARRPPIGSCWRILVQEPHLAAESGNYTALNERATDFEQGRVFDELVIVFEPDPENPGRRSTSKMRAASTWSRWTPATCIWELAT